MNHNIFNYLVRILMAFIFLFVSVAKAQTPKPGGITTSNVNTELWMRADSLPNLLTTGHGATITTWNDVSGNGRDHTGISYLNKTGWVDGYTTKHYMMNYQPSLYFAGTAQLTGGTFYNSGKAYYIFYVSEQIGSNNTYFNVVYSINNTNDNFTGWNGGLPAFRTGGTTDRKYGAVPRTNGIVAVIRPNSTTKIDSQYIYYNGNYTRVAGDELTSKTGSSEIGNCDKSKTYAYALNGNIQELIVLSGTKGNGLNATDIAKVNSYLAIKYGQTLSVDYVNSAGTSVWIRANNTGYTSTVFGIARDDASSLYQKQAISYTDQTFTAFVGDAIYPLNQQNPAVLDNNVYLLFGSNGAENVAPYNQVAGTAFDNTTLQNESFFKRLNRTYKVQLTGTNSFTVKLSLTGFAGFMPDYAMVTSSSNTAFSPATTRLYPVDNGIVTIEVHSGDIISFGYTYTKSLENVVSSNVELWLKADEVYRHRVITHGTDVTRWENHSGKTFDFARDGDNVVPKFTTNNGMNYNPAITFESSAKRLNSTEIVATSSDKMYMTFYVSTANTTALSKKYGTLFSYKTGSYYDEGWYGNSNEDYLGMRGGTSDALLKTNPGLNSRSGIVSFYRRAEFIQPYHNAHASTWKGVTALQKTSQTQTIGARSNGDNPFYGTIQEIIMISADTNSAGFNLSDRRKIYSYLAIKYGLSLESDQPNLYNSQGNIVWDSTLHAGYNNNIFGIARDDGTSLYQKQSTNVDDKIMTVFLGNTLRNLNYDNPATIDNNNTYLLFGSGSKVYTPYVQAAGTSYDNGATTDTVSVILRKFKTQMTGATSFTVSIASHAVAPYTAKYVLVSASDAFTPTSTRIYPINSNIASGVLINAGDYVALAGGPFPAPSAPGGVTSYLRMWLNAENTSTLTINSNTGEVTSWRDQLNGANNTNNVEYKSDYDATNLVFAQPPLYRKFEPKTNYHPAIFFENDASGEALSSANYKRFLTTDKGPMTVASPDLYHYFVVMYNNFGSIKRTYFLSYGQKAFDAHYYNTSRPTFGLDGTTDAGVIGRFREDNGGAGFINGTKALYKLDATAIGYYGIQKEPTKKIRFEYDGYGEDITNGLSNLGKGSNLSTASGILGGGSHTNRDIRGVISEIIAYEGTLTDPDKDKIYSYLGLKYGVTLDKDKSIPTLNFDYRLSNGDTVWAGTSDALHQNYHHNVAAIVRDDVAGLNNMQSHSTDAGTVVTMGIGTKLGENPALTGLKNDKEVIIWGNNGLTGTIGGNLCGGLDTRTNRIWMVDNLTQQDYEVRIGAGVAQSTVFPYGGPAYEVYLLVSKTATGFASSNAHVIPGVYNNVTGLHEFSYTFEQGVTYYFSFSGRSIDGVACKGCEYTGQKSLPFTSGNWTSGTKSKTYPLGDDFSVTVNVSSVLGNGGFATGYPRASSGNTLRLRRKNSSNNVQTAMTARMTFTSASLPSFKIYSIGRSSNVSDEIQVYGMCNGAKVIPRLTYVAGEKNSSYKINNYEDIFAHKSSTYTSSRGTMQVVFDIPVTDVYVVYSRGSSSGEIGIGPLTFRCPPPAPTINEDGLGFSKDAPAEVELCENVQYVFRLVNTNCNPVTVNFTDTLPAGMKWLAESLILADANIGSSTLINSYDGTDVLKIDSIIVAPGSHTFMVTAKFDNNAQAGTYNNRARIEYDKIINSNHTPVYMYSCDAYKGCEFPTSVLATGTNTHYESLNITEYVSSKDFYMENDTITINMKFNNPNNIAFTDNYKLNFIYNEEFRYIKNSVTSSGMTIGAPQFEVDGSDTVQGYLYFNVTNIPMGPSTISLKFKAPDKSGLALDGEGVEESFVVGFDMETEMEDVCKTAIFDEFYDEIEVPFLPCPPISGYPITFETPSNTVCAGSDLVFTVSTEVECSFGNNITYRLEHKQIGASAWTTKQQGDTIIDCTDNVQLTRTLQVHNIAMSDAGMYRILISTTGRINTEECRATSDTLSITVNPAVTASMITVAGTTTICSGTTTTLAASVSDVVTNPKYKWYASQTETTPIYEEANFTTPTLMRDTVFYVSVSGDNYCGNDTGSRKEVKITVKPFATATMLTVTGDKVICSGATTTLTASASDGVTNPIYRWYNSQTGTSEIHTGEIFTTLALTGNTVFYVSVAGDNYCENIENDRKPVSITVKQIATNILILGEDTTVCYGSSITFNEDTTQLLHPVFNWYTSQTGTLIYTGSSYTTPALTSDTTFYIGVSDDNYCENEQGQRKEIRVTVNPICAFDDNVTTSCESMPVTVIVLVNDILDPDCTPVIVVDTIVGPTNGTARVVGTSIEYTGNLSGMDSLTYVVRCGTDTSMAKIYFNTTAPDDVFVDDVWYFGVNTASATGKSPGIRFVKDNVGGYIAENASGESNVRSYENSLVVSSPYCDGQTIFYASHNQLYNSLHDSLKDGDFAGNNSIADGLAACYMGENKYLFFSVTDEYNAATRGLRAYVIDMNADNGKGALINTIEVEPAHTNMSETIELIPRAGTTNQYWLVYPHRNGINTNKNSNEIRVRLVDVSKPSNQSIASTYSSVTKTDSRTYSIGVSQQYDRIAVINMNGTANVFKFNDTTGTLSDWRTIEGIQGTAYGMAFSPDGKQLYTTGYNGENAKLYQCDISGENPVKIDSIQYWSQGNDGTKGGGLKLGPDGNIYVTISHTTKVGVISNPDLKTALTSRYSPTALEIGFTYTSLQFSTGLTKPAIMACNQNTPPTANADTKTFCASPTSRTVKVNVLANDADADNDKIYLTNAYFDDMTDATDATIEVADSTVSLILNQNDVIGDGRTFNITYEIKDNGLPASKCATGTLSIEVHNSVMASDIDITGDTAICFGLTTTLTANIMGPINVTEYRWYSSQTETMPLHEGMAPFTTPNLTENTTFYVSAVGQNHCENDTGSRKEVTVTVHDYPTEDMINVDGDDNPCYGTKTTLTVSSPLLIINPVYKWYASQTEATPFHTGESYTTPALMADTAFYVSISDDNDCENEQGHRKEVKIKVNPICAFNDSAATFCEKEAVTIDVLFNDIVSPNCTPLVEIAVAPTDGTASVDGYNIKYTGNLKGIDSLTYVVRCVGGTDTSIAKVYFRLDTSNTAFVDDIWYFGQDSGNSTGKSAGIRFVKNGLGKYEPKDASGESNVYTEENSLVVSSPYCDGQTIFYSNHSQLYNSLHELMDNGTFSGNSSVADGLAACYMGENKYLFFSVTNEYGATPRGLRAYVVDMNEDNGKGALKNLLNNGIIETDGVAESIGLVAKAGTSDQYWLIYAHLGTGSGGPYGNFSNELRVRSVNVSNPSNPVIEPTYKSFAKSPSTSYTLAVSQQSNRVAIANSSTRSVDVFDFDNSTNGTGGDLTNHRSIGIANLTNRSIYGVEFSPNGNQLYFSVYDQYTTNPVLLYQYDISGTPVRVDSIQYWSQTVNTRKGGGLKLGPDGKIYVTLCYTNQVGAISDPDNSTSTLASRYSNSALTLSVPYSGLQFSAGLTKPAIMSCNTNNAPRTTVDSATWCISSVPSTIEVIEVNVLENDADVEHDDIYLTNAYFVNIEDTALATLTVNAVDSTIILTLNPNADLEKVHAHVFDIIYDIKDNGLPASQCATGSLKIKSYLTPSLSSTLTPSPICSDSLFNYTATSAVSGTTFSWSRTTLSEIAEPATSGTGANISERLTNTSASPVEVIYLITSTVEECYSTDTVKVIVRAKLTGGTIGASQTFCYGTTLNIPLGTTPPTGGNGSYTYQWQNSTDSMQWNNIGSATSETYTLTGTLTQTTWYRRVATDICGIVYSDTVQIAIDSLPVVSAVSPDICVGTNTLLFPLTGGTWATESKGFVSISNNNTATGVKKGTETLTFTSSTTQCSQTLDITVDVFPDVEEITGDHAVCVGKTISLTNPTTGGKWTSNNNGVSITNPNVNPATVKGETEGKTFITYTVSNGICETKRTFLLKVISNTPPEIIIGIER